MRNQVWLVSQSRAELKTSHLCATFELTHPELGLGELVVQGRDLPQASWLAPTVSHRAGVDVPAEVYVRGEDLVIKYPPRNTDLVSYQVYYRPIWPGESSYGLELVLSAQTSLLTSDPRIEVRTKLSAGELLFATADDDYGELHKKTRHFNLENEVPAHFLMRPTQLPTKTLVLLVRDSDFFSATASCEHDGPNVSFMVFPDSLEKGVIRRATFRSVIVPRHDDEASARRLSRLLNTSPPQLAT